MRQSKSQRQLKKSKNRHIFSALNNSKSFKDYLYDLIENNKITK